MIIFASTKKIIYMLRMNQHNKTNRFSPEAGYAMCGAYYNYC